MSSIPPSAGERRLELRKYPNRRYYNTVSSQYVTLEGIYSAIRDGYDVHVTDSKTGEDITAKVLAQIILEQDAPKLDVFPAALLHQVIRANEPLIRDFIDKYFSRALSAFLDSQRHFDQYLRQTLGLQATIPHPQDWARMMMGPFSPAFFAAGNAGATGPEHSSDDSASEDLREQVEQLRKQLDSLQRHLEEKP